jgi:glycosyltransferase involved in cell wall biosynthesis
MKKILYLVSEDSFFCSHRLDLAAFMRDNGYIVAVAAKFSKPCYKQMILDQKLEFFELRYFNRARIWNMFKEIWSLKEIYYIYKEFKPDLVHHVALKPVIYGTLIAKLLKIKKVINALAGLGFVFTDLKDHYYENCFIKFYKNISIKIKQKFLQSIVYNFLKLIIQDHCLLLQNHDDLELLTKTTGININKTKVFIIPGSGITMEKYYQSPVLTKDSFNNGIKIVLLSRLLWTKGVYEFIQAAKKVQEYIKNNNLNIVTEFIIYGDIDTYNPASVNYSDLQLWSDQKIISWKKFCKDVVLAYSNCHIVVLPSYREGLPKSLLEAAACARPIITTDVPGCKEIVKQGVNGYLVPKENSETLAVSIVNLMQNPELMINMGRSGREIVLNNFSTQVIFPKTLAMYLS